MGVRAHLDPPTARKWGGQDPMTPTGSPPLVLNKMKVNVTRKIMILNKCRKKRNYYLVCVLAECNDVVLSPVANYHWHVWSHCFTVIQRCVRTLTTEISWKHTVRQKIICSTNNLSQWLGSVVVRAPDLWSTGREFISYIISYLKFIVPPLHYKRPWVHYIVLSLIHIWRCRRRG